MKRSILFTLMAMLFILSACAGQVNEGSKATAISPVTSETRQPIMTPTPVPTLPEGEKKTRNEYNELIDLCESYNDWSAALLLHNMYIEGSISENQFSNLKSIEAFKGLSFDEKEWGELGSRLKKIGDVLNDQTRDIGKEDLIGYLSGAIKHGSVYIMIFDIAEKRERVKKGIDMIRDWFKGPTDNNFKGIREFYLSEKLTPGEKVLLYCYITNSPDRPKKIKIDKKNSNLNDYLTKIGVTGIYKDALEALYS